MLLQVAADQKVRMRGVLFHVLSFDGCGVMTDSSNSPSSGLIYGLEFQCRALSAVDGDGDKVKFLVGTQSLKMTNQASFFLSEAETSVCVLHEALFPAGPPAGDSRRQRDPGQDHLPAPCWGSLGLGVQSYRYATGETGLMLIWTLF